VSGKTLLGSSEKFEVLTYSSVKSRRMRWCGMWKQKYSRHFGW